jgi:hypothetical protein
MGNVLSNFNKWCSKRTSVGEEELRTLSFGPVLGACTHFGETLSLTVFKGRAEQEWRFHPAGTDRFVAFLCAAHLLF